MMSDRPANYWPTQYVFSPATGMLIPIVDRPELTDEERLITDVRLQTEMTGTCPKCGARLILPNRATRRAAKGRKVTVNVVHADDCPAADRSIPTLPRLMGDVA